MVSFFGDYDTTETIDIPFNTFSSDDPSASVTITNLALGDIKIHKDGAVAQRTETAGVTVSVDFDGQTGAHMVHIDLSDNTHAGFYAAGSRYQVRIEGTTVDGATINSWIGAFSIGCTLRPVTAGRTLVVDAAGLADANVVKVGPTGAGTVQTANDMSGDIDDILGDTNELQGDDVPTLIAALPTAVEIQAEMEANGASILDSISDVLPGSTIAAATDIPAMVGTDNAALASVVGTLADAAAAGEVTAADTLMQYLKQLINILIGTPGIGAFPAEGAPANGVSLAEVIRAIHVDVTGLNGSAMIGTNGANTTTPPTVGEIQAEMEENGASVLDTIRDNVGTPVALDGAAATLGAMLTKMADDNAGADFDAGTDSLQAVRDRGDAAWITGGGGGITDILSVNVLIPQSIDLANTVTVRIGLGLTNMLDDLPSAVEITPGTITIDRKAIGGTSWLNVVNTAACSEAAGLVYYDEVFDTGTGYAAGDSIRITFKSQKITVAANDYEITDATGWIFQTHIREAMRGTNGANTTTPPTVTEIQTEMEENGASILDSISDLLPGSTIAAATDIPTTAEIQTELEENGASILDTLQDRLTATRAGYLDQLDFALQEAIAALPTAIEIQAEMEENGASVLDTIRDHIEHGTYGLSAIETLVDELETRLSAARAGYLDELAAANLPTDVDTLLTRLSAVRAGYLDELAAANLPADLDAVLTDTNELQTDDIPAAIAALNDITVAQVLAGIIDGAVDLKEALTQILAYASGDVAKVGNAYAYKKRDDVTTAFTNTAAIADRTRS